MKPIVIIQARQSSNRLPNKVLLPINKLSIIEIIYKRVKSNNFKTIVAISNDRTDDLLCSLLKLKKIPHFRGSLHNVKSRYLNICEKYSNKKVVVRLTADNIFPDKNLIKEMIVFFLKNKKNYLYINQKTNKIPCGLSVEIFNLGEIRKFRDNNIKDLEHVTYSIKKKNNEFNIESNLRFKKKASIDNLGDYFLIKNFFEKYNLKTNIHWKLLIKKFNSFCKFYRQKSIKNNSLTSKIILGGAQIGNLYGINNKSRMDYDDIKKLSRFTKIAGIYGIDTARDYPNSEKLIGKYFSNNKSLNIFTKLSKKIDNLKEDGQIKNFLKNSINKSRQNLKPFKIQCLYVHNLSNDIDLNLKIFKNLFFLKNKYKINKIGLSITNLKEIDLIINSKLKKYIDIVQLPYSFVDQRLNKKNINVFKKYKITIIFRSIFLQGLIFLRNKKLWPTKIKRNYHIFFKKLNYTKNKLKIISTLELALLYMFSKNMNNKIIVGVNSFSQFTEIYSLLFRRKLTKKEINFVEKQFKTFNENEFFLNPSLWKKIY
ncbi:aldo/keto reductase [Candidatus Pelagibacter sp.]|uniref:aldo/keto reductase n=1 Tax=Candidatus Pelagibacter sp. TaxID=2024849 RepID=UPI003F83370D